MKTAIATLESTSPYSQSRYVKVPKLEKDSNSALPAARAAIAALGASIV